MALEVRALMPDDADTARRFVSGQFSNPRYRARALEVLESALEFEETTLQTHVADIRDGLHELARRFPEAHQRLIAVRW